MDKAGRRKECGIDMKVYGQEIQIPRAVREIYPFESRWMDVQGHRMHYLDEGERLNVLKWNSAEDVYRKLTTCPVGHSILSVNDTCANLHCPSLRWSPSFSVFSTCVSIFMQPRTFSYLHETQLWIN